MCRTTGSEKRCWQHSRRMRIALSVLLLVLPVTASLVLARSGPKWREYPTRYYIVHSDLDEETVREACLRVTAMADEYQDRTSGFTGRITTRLPFFLFARFEDYRAAGTIPGSYGMYDARAKRLLATLEPPVGERSWIVVQHEGFHQFVASVIGGDIPVWVNEGLAEYFGAAIFTGDGMISGLVPPDRLARIQSGLRNNEFIPFPKMMTIDGKTWNAEIKRANYDQAWSMVHFLAHAEDGRFRPFFDGFLRDVSRKGLAWDIAWRRNFGVGVEDFEARWKAYWLAQPENPTGAEYDRAAVAKFTSLLARATASGQHFAGFDAFVDAVRKGDIRMPRNQWLPSSLGAGALEQIASLSCKLDSPRARPPRLVCTSASGAEWTGSFSLKGKAVAEVQVRQGKR